MEKMMGFEKAPFNLNGNKADHFMSMLNEVSQRRKANKERSCFMYSDDFDNSKRFARFVNENLNTLSSFLEAHFCTYEFGESEGVIKNGIPHKTDSLVRFLGDSIKAYHHMKSNEVCFEKDEFQEYLKTEFAYDVSLRTRKYLFSSVWQKEKRYFDALRTVEKTEKEDDNINDADTSEGPNGTDSETDMDSSDTYSGDEDEPYYDCAVYEVLDLWITHSDNAAYNAFFYDVPTFREIIDYQMKELCRYRIQSLVYSDDNVNETTYYKLGLLKDKDCLDFILDLLGAMIVESERVLDYIYDMVRNEESLRLVVDSYKRGFDRFHDDYVNDVNILNEKLYEGKQKLIESESNYKVLENKINDMCEDAAKPLRKEISDYIKKLEKQEEKYQKLLNKYDVLTEYIEQLENMVKVEDNPEDADDSGISFADFPADMFTKKIVFVREKQFSHYIIMRKLQSYFPNSNFTNGVSGDIDMKSTDVVILMTRYVKHGTYWGARDASKRAGVPYVHCEYTNIPLVLKTIADFC